MIDITFGLHFCLPSYSQYSLMLVIKQHKGKILFRERAKHNLRWLSMRHTASSDNHLGLSTSQVQLVNRILKCFLPVGG